MSALQIHQRPQLRSPLLIAGWTGWNDAGEAASSAVRFIHRRWRAETIADLDPEEFYDFTQARPHVRLQRGERVIEWPTNTFSARRDEDRDHDVILLMGVEPHLAWRTYVDAIVQVCREFEVAGVLTLGALLAEVSHQRPVRVSGSASHESLRGPLRLPERRRSSYQGPTGVVGVVTQALREEGIPTASMWANMPFYVQRAPNPKGSLALLERINQGFGFDLSLHDLEVFAARFEAQIATDIEANPEIAEYARRVAEMDTDEEDDEPAPPAEELPDAASMVDELERFLRDQRGDGGER